MTRPAYSEPHEPFLPVTGSTAALVHAIREHAKAMLEVAAAIREHTQALSQEPEGEEEGGSRYYMDGTRIV